MGPRPARQQLATLGGHCSYLGALAMGLLLGAGEGEDLMTGLGLEPHIEETCYLVSLR